MQTVLVLLLVCLSVGAGAAPVVVTVDRMTFQVQNADYAKDINKPDGSTKCVENERVEVVRLNNGLVEAWVAPAWGARLLRVIDLQTRNDYFAWKEPIEGHLGFGGVGVEAGFPFFEHGIHLHQPAGYRVVEDPDGSATVAMDMRFTHHQEKRDTARYGRYSDEILSVMVTVRPGSTLVEWRQRKDNPNPTPRSDRLWNNALFEVQRIMKAGKIKKRNPEYKKGGKEPKTIFVDGRVADEDATKAVVTFIYPARYVVDHGPTTVHTSPHYSNPENWNVSHFGIDAIYGFVGLYDSRKKTSCLRINDPLSAPGAKLYSCWWGNFCEFWGGSGIVFEHPGNLRPGHDPVEFSHRFYLAQDLGQVDFANDDVAVAVDGKAFELVSPVTAKASVADDSGKDVASGLVGPHEVLKGAFDGKRLVVTLDSRKVLDQVFPLDLPVPEKGRPVPPEIQRKFEALKRYEPSRPELEQLMNNEGLTTARNAMGDAKKVTTGDNPDRALSLARACYRLGHLNEARRIADLCPGPDADFLKGLVEWEKTGATDFGKAGWQANYMRALAAMQKQDTKEGIQLVGDYLDHVPKAWYPRLAKAYWEKNEDAAQTLANENPASPEAQLVLDLLGVKRAEREKDKLLKNNPDAAEQVENFRLQITKGEWKPMKRYGLAKP